MIEGLASPFQKILRGPLPQLTAAILVEILRRQTANRPDGKDHARSFCLNGCSSVVPELPVLVYPVYREPVERSGREGYPATPEPCGENRQAESSSAAILATCGGGHSVNSVNSV